MSCRTISGTGILGQRANQVSDDVYGARTLGSYLNRAAFAFPAPRTLGGHRKNSIERPGYWSVDLALSRGDPTLNGGHRGLPEVNPLEDIFAVSSLAG